MNQFQRPLVVVLIAFLAGLLLALRFAPPLSFLVPLYLSTLATVGYGHLRGTSEPRGWKRSLVLLLLLGSGAIVGTLAHLDSTNDCRVLFRDDAELEVRGRLGAAHRRGTLDAPLPLLPLLQAEVDGVRGCGGEIKLRMPRGQPELDTGAPLRVRGRWRTFAPPVTVSRWPREPLNRGFLAADTVLESSEGPRALPAWLALRARTDARLRRLFGARLPIVEALLLGRAEYMDPEVRDRFSRAGLSHLLAISGTHVGLLATALLLVASALRLSRRRAIPLTLAATWIYMLVIGAPSSALRAGVMITFGLLAFVLQRPSSALSIIAAAAFAVLAIRPLAILDAGFQLSFAGVLGILLLRPPLLALVPGYLKAGRVLRALTEAFIVGVAAFIPTAPIVAHHFGIVAPVSIIVGIPTVPLTSLALIGTGAALVADPLVPQLAELLASGTGVALDAVSALAGLAASLPHGSGSVPPPPWWSWIIAGGIGFGAASATGSQGKRLPWIAGVGGTVVVLVVWPVIAPGGFDGLEVHFVDVGQGDAVAIRTPGNHWVLVDTGPASDDFDAGERRVVPFLRSHGAHRLEALVLTHPDLDHIGGAGAVVKAIPVRHVFEPGLAVGKDSYLQLIGLLELPGADWRAARSGRTLELDGVHFNFLWPDPETVDVVADANQISAVMKVTYGAFTLLLTGDAGIEVEEVLAARHSAALRSQVLKLGHHGSATSTAEIFLDQVHPELAVVSAGRRNRYGHPAPSVIARLERRGIPVARTDQEGTISLRVWAGGATWQREE